MADALGDHKSTVSIGGSTISNLRFADDIDGLARSELELANRVQRLGETSTTYGMQISAEKTKLMTNDTNSISSNIRVNGGKLETVESFKYLAAIVTDEGSVPGIRSRIVHTIAALTKLKIIWDDKNIDLSSKIRLSHSLVMSIFLYSCEKDINSRNREKDTDSGNEKFQTSPWHLVQRPHHQRRGAKQDSESHWAL